ncbi:MAG: diguanylate cyclase [Proteobacteria bacterium]|nr:diguanylate cyclase [Pseudomonadota bacterium]MBU1714901.1 diguanylate cyclase [Pseudomonadota bacterium]
MTHNDFDHSASLPGSHHLSGSKFVKKYVGIISVVICLVILSVFWGFHARNSRLIKDNLLHEGRAFFQELVLTRQWIIQNNGIYIKEAPDTVINHQLDAIPGLKNTIVDQDGDRYIFSDHAVITRKLSEMGMAERLFQFKITSLNPFNPINEPDNFEHSALKKFEQGTKEVYAFEEKEDRLFFRYMAPLVTNKECLPCHSIQGYNLGDIRGGISVSIPANETKIKLVASRTYTIVSGVLIITLILSIIIYISHHFINDLKKSERKLYQMATTDFLTGLLNRGEGLRRFNREISLSERKGQPLSTIILDIDHFKSINDNYGHQTGDQVIEKTAQILRATLREYDIICRYGGEEFLLILPMTPLKKAIEIAERLRLTIANTIIPEERKGVKIAITISLGVAQHKPGESLDGLIYKVDNSMYIAKEEGRNRIHYLE